MNLIKNEWKLFSVKKILITLGILLIGVLYYLEIRILGVKIPCLFYSTTGWKCPGCGITHLALFILRGDFQSAYTANMGLFIISPMLFVLIIVSWYRWITNRSNNIKIISVCAMISVIFLLIWCVFRNIHGV